MKKIIIKNMMAIAGAVLLHSCIDLDVTPPNFTTDDEIFTSDDGVEAYMARIYKDVPIVQFFQGDLANSAESDRYTTDITTRAWGGEEADPGSLSRWNGHYDSRYMRYVWDYGHIRRTNYFLETIDLYVGNFAASKVSSWKAQAYWIRAFRYFEMVKRYGGVPIEDRVLNYPEESLESIKHPRSKEKECYDFILTDCDNALALFAQSTAERIEGYANKWDVLALKSRVALYAASIAKYGPKYSQGHLYADGVTGVPTEYAAEYFQTAYEAAEAIVQGGQYALYKNSWKAGDAAAIKKNFEEIFYTTPGANKEAMFSRQYMQGLSSAWYSKNCLPYQFNPTYGGSISVTLDVVERYEYADAGLLPPALQSKAGERFALTTALTGTDNAPILYKNPSDVFEGLEPRLQASVTLPGSILRGEEVEVRFGIMPKGKSTFDEGALLHSDNFDAVYEADGQSMKVQGKSGMGLNNTTPTGIYPRKWFDPSVPEEYIKDTSHGDVNPWIEFRYAEVLLNIAEAAAELKDLTGDASKMAEAAQIIHDIRERAGAKADKYTAATLTIDAVRSERRKEFLMENKIFWDQRRWRTAHEEIDAVRKSAVRPVYFWDGDGDKHYYMWRGFSDLNADKRYTFIPRCYYFDIPQDKANDLIIPNPGQTF